MDLLGNLPGRWRQTADSLLAAARALEEQRECSMQISRANALNGAPPTIAPQLEFYTIEKMLIGFALENLLKGLWLAQGNTLYSKARLDSSKLGPSHALTTFCEKTGFELTPEEHADLQMLKKIMTGAGRYPMSADQSESGQYYSWTHEADKRVHALALRLIKVFEDTETKNQESNAKRRVEAFQRQTGEA